MKPSVFSRHALEHITDRGTTAEEAELAIRTGECSPAKVGRLAYRENFPFGKEWKGRRYETKQVMPIIKEESDRIIVITVYAFYFGEAK